MTSRLLKKQKCCLRKLVLIAFMQVLYFLIIDPAKQKREVDGNRKSLKPFIKLSVYMLHFAICWFPINKVILHTIL